MLNLSRFIHIVTSRLTVIVSVMVVLCTSAFPVSQSSRIRGEVRDSITGELLGFINIYSPDSKKATVTDESGIFYFNIPSQGLTLKASSLGYSSVEKRFTPKDTLLSILLSPEATYLEEVTVRPKKQKYSKRNNPAVEFMERIRAAKDKTDPRNEELYSYRLYEKIVMGLNDFNPKRLDGKKNGKFGFLKNCIDTALWTGKTILDLTIKEKVATHIYSSDPKRSKEIVEGVRSVGIDDILDKANVQTAVGDVMREVDIYSPSITLLQNRFVSPLSPLGPDVYRYYLTDTVTIGDERYIELSFSPRNPETMGFNGKLYVAEGDSSMFIKRVTMRVPSAINLNYVNSLSISQNFVKDSLGNRHKILDDMTAELQLIPGTPEFYARRLAIYDSFSYTPGDSVASRLDRLGNQFVIDEAENRNDLFWTSNRMIPLSAAEASMNGLMTGFRKFPLIYWGEKIVGIIARGYIRTGDPSRFDFGPVNSFISFNDVEGIRLKVGGLTTANLSPHLFARGYVAYGFKDGKPKYRIEGEYSFSRKKYHSREFPVHALRALHQYDLDRLGQHYLFTSPDNIFLSLKRKGDDLVTYRRLSEFNYILELRNNFSLQATLRHEVQNKSHWIEFENGFGQHFSKFTQSAICVALRWAPGETFTQGYTNRAPVNMDAPIFQLTHEYGPKGFLGADFLLNRSEISIQKRIWLSAFGYFDAIVKGGIIWSQVYYPALLWPNVNLSYTIQPESYALMDAMEFANDRYASLDVTYWSQGLLFNHLPWVSKLKLRETISFKALWGGLSHKNNPEYNPSLLKFPSDAGCRVMSGRPYMELGIGLDNILTILRVEYIWRLSYRDLPGTDKSGLRIALHFSF